MELKQYISFVRVRVHVRAPLAPLSMPVFVFLSVHS